MRLKRVTILLAVLLVILSAAVGVLLFNFVIKPQSTIVPDFIGKPVSDVYVWCAGLDDDHSCEVSYEDSAEYEKDIVFEQSITGGNKMKVSVVSFKASNGEGNKIILPFVGPETNKSDIEAWALTFHVTNITYIEEVSDTVEKNHIIRIEPTDNVTRDTPLKVYVSIGKEERQEKKEEEKKEEEVIPSEIEVKYGDYIGWTVEEFEKKAEALHLKANHNTKRDQYDPHIAFGNIVWHGSGIYVPGETFNYGICVNELVISAGQYVGLTEDEFIKKAKESSLVPTHLSNRDSFSTSVANGSVVTHGSGVYVKDEAFNYGLSLGPAKVESGYEGTSEEVFLSYLSRFGLTGNRKSATSETIAAG